MYSSFFVEKNVHISWSPLCTFIHIIIKEKCDKGKAIYICGDDDLNSNGGDALGLHDDYFGCQINEKISFVARFVPIELLGSYEHPL